MAIRFQLAIVDVRFASNFEKLFYITIVFWKCYRISGASKVSMKKSTVFSIGLLTLLSLGLTVVPNVSSQPENIKVLSYSWYTDSADYFTVVGEVQNTGPNTMDRVSLSAAVYTKDGAAQARWYALAWVKYLIPQQKAPFYIQFNSQTTTTGDFSWLSLGVDRVDFVVGLANATSSYQYPDLTLESNSPSVEEGVYWVGGTIKNTGNQTAKNVRVIGTFYDASGTVIAAGFTDPLTPTSLLPSETILFRVRALDLDQANAPSDQKISKYALLIQTEEPILSGTPPSPSTNTPTDTPPSSTDHSDSNSNNPADSTPWATYAIVVIAAILGIVGTTLLLTKRKSQAQKKKRKAQVRRKKK